MRLRCKLFWVMVMSLSLMFACTPAEEQEDKADEEKAEKVEQQEEVDYKAEGEAVGQEILDTFDAAVADVAATLAEKPEPAEAKEKITAVMESYKPKMEELAKKKLALLDMDITAWGAVNSYLGENRGKRVFKKDQTLTELMNYYTIQKPDEELTKMFSTLTRLIDLADAPNPNY